MHDSAHNPKNIPGETPKITNFLSRWRKPSSSSSYGSSSYGLDSGSGFRARPGFLPSKFSRRHIFGILALFLIGFGGLQALASAQNNDDSLTQSDASQSAAIQGTLTRLNEKEVSFPVPDVSISVFSNDQLIGESTSDETGMWRVEVPRAGTYKVRIDTTTLPDGLELANPDLEELEDVVVREGQQKRVIFRLGEGVSSGISRVERFSNLFLAGLQIGAILAIAGAGLALIFSVTNLVNFAHGELLTLGAVLAFFFSTSGAGPGWHLLLAIIPAILVAAMFSAGLEISFWEPLRSRGVSDTSMMIISIGLSLMLRYFFLIVMGGEVRSYDSYATQQTISFLSFTTTPKTIFVLAISVVILLAMGAMLLLTKHGTSIRALADNVDLAKASGINIKQTIQITWVLAAATTALGGIFLSISQGVEWEMGFQILLLIFAGLILGGTKNPFGAMVGGFLVGIFTEVSTYWIGTEFKIAIALSIMALTLLIRPQGILGQKLRKA